MNKVLAETSASSRNTPQKYEESNVLIGGRCDVPDSLRSEEGR